MHDPSPNPPVSSLNRRRLLCNAGVTVCLPWMESLPTFGRQPLPTDRPVRLACLFMPNGVHVPSWQPKAEGADWELTPTLQPLDALRSEVSVCTGLRNVHSFAGEGHYVKTTALLSGAKVKKTGGHDIRCGVSVDQLAARHIGSHTPLPSMQLAIEPVSNIVDMGYSTVYGAHISWRTPTQPAPREIHPRQAFERMFRGADLGSPRNKMVLDVVREDSARLAGTLGGADRDKLREYLEAVHAVELRVRNFTAARHAEARDLAAGRRPESLDPKTHAIHVRLMLELIVLAFRADATRLCTFMFGNAVSGRDFSFLDGVRGGFHPISHHQNDPEKQRQYARINRWHVEQYAWLLEQLRGIDDHGKSLLDRSMILLASGLGDGNSHDPKSLPVLFAGRGGGRLAPGRHHVFKTDRRLCSLHLSMLHCLGVKATVFGDSDRTLPQLFA